MAGCGGPGAGEVVRHEVDEIQCGLHGFQEEFLVVLWPTGRGHG